jgi:hypothetical protein
MIITSLKKTDNEKLHKSLSIETKGIEGNTKAILSVDVNAEQTLPRCSQSSQ